MWTLQQASSWQARAPARMTRRGVAPPKKGPSSGLKMAPKKAKAHCRPSHFGEQILVHIEGVIFRPVPAGKHHRDAGRAPCGTLLAHATARRNVGDGRNGKERMPATAARQMCRHLWRAPVNGHFAGAAGAPHPGQNAFFAIFEKKGVAGVFREATATANRNGVQAKRSFFDRRRDFWVSNI